MENNIFKIELNAETGNMTSLIIAEDGHRMNWCGGTHEWGEFLCGGYVYENNKYVPKRSRLISFREDKDKAESIFSNGKIETRVYRSFTENGNFKEEYTFKNISDSDVFFRKGEFGIYTPFADEYIKAAQSLAKRCNTHIWCGENVSWINALRQGKSNLNIGLFLSEESLACYSIDRDNQKLMHETRGNIILNPAAAALVPEEAITVAWEIFVHSGTEEFEEKFKKHFGIGNIITDRYTYYENEDISFGFECDSDAVKISCGNEEVPFLRNNGMITVNYTPKHTGEYKFFIEFYGIKTHVLMNVVKPLDTIINNRIAFIVEKQQYMRKDSALYGAYLIYDNEDKTHYFDEDRVDHNACRERLGMGILIARYLQKHKNKSFFESLMLYVEFVKREFLDTETGEVFNTVGKNRNQIRLYNAPWMIVFMTELYRLTGDMEYIEIIHRALNNYYSLGGAEFYPNGFDMKLITDTIRSSGKSEYADEAMKFFKLHTDNMLKNGTDYPAMEVIYEQTIVTPVVSFLCDMASLTGEEKYICAAEEHLENLLRFGGSQPDYHLNNIPIRYWDDYWFGKSDMYADVFPHYWSCLTARAWHNYSRVSGNEKYRKMADNCIRSCLCLFMEDGSASCAYVYPYKIDKYKGGFFDAWANDQDFALYFSMVLSEDN